MSFRRAPRSVFIATTPTSFCFAFSSSARQLGLHRDEVEAAR